LNADVWARTHVRYSYNVTQKADSTLLRVD
jgi:hypothetical protein